MSYKYIPQVENQNFVYPNNDLAEYDVNIIHNVDNYSVSGTVTNFVNTVATTTGLTFTYDYTWSKNGAEPFISEAGNIHLLSVHMMAAGQTYYKPWRCVDLVTSGTTTGSTYSGSDSFSVTAAQMGLTEFINGTFYLEFRFIGSKAIYPVCNTYTLSTLPTPTPTPTPTVTPTPTPTSTPTVTPTPTATPVNLSSWTVRNDDCGFGTLNDVGINGNFMGTLSGPSTFPLTSGLYGTKTNPSGINYGISSTIQCNVTTNLPGTGNCGVIRIYMNGSISPTYEEYFTSNPFPQVTGVVINNGDTVELSVQCFSGPCP